VLIILPPSETKLPPPERGSPVDLERLSFPSLTEMRERVIGALVETSGRPDALRRLMVRPSLAGDVARNEHLRDLATRRAVDTYAGPLYAGLDAGSWSPHAEHRAARHLVIVSALWGALRPADHIPPYRLNACARLAGMDRLEPAWRPLLSPILTDTAARRGPILDLRSRVYQAVGRPIGLDDQTVTLRIRPSSGGPAHIGDVIAKRVRGEAASHVLSSTADPDDPLDIADLLATRWELEVDPPTGRDRTWTITLHSTVSGPPVLAGAPPQAGDSPTRQAPPAPLSMG
jgi:cytoplasmic iron level regulating protein YaaA (DUF328/UPF0246 family)